MSSSSPTSPTAYDLPGFLDALSTLSTSERSAFALRYASQCLEYIAYENSEGQSPDQAAALICLAAHLDTLAKAWSQPLN